MTAPKNYKNTLQLPQTDFPMRANLVQREPERLARWEKTGLYGAIQKKRAQAEPYILHDGPPFANGDVHMGTALNKILKDFVVKARTMEGYRVPFIPGWDCHGLPIEFKVIKEATGATPVEIRQRSEAYARKYIAIQKKSFRRLGVFGDWEHPYLTLDPAYEADILRTFGRFIELDLVYRSKKPVYWSYGAHTALAEAEVEYKDKVSPSIYVAFPLVPRDDIPEGASVVIWTTTPWTLPANQAVALHPRFHYVLGKFSHSQHRDATLLIAKELLEDFSEKTGYTLSETLQSWTGDELENWRAKHPFHDRLVPLINGEFVTLESGTGAVHIAPGHGLEDYVAGQKYQLPIVSPVDDEGCFTAECGVAAWVGEHVFKANPKVIALLEEKGRLLGHQEYRHSYPHCWRSKTPVIFRALAQWFIRIDALRDKALAEIDRVRWIPTWGRNRIYGTVESRPDWCISRQRTWGVPIPIFFDDEGAPILDPNLVEKVAQEIETHGSNRWFELDDAQWAKIVGLPEGTTRSSDTLDVWIDSGTSHFAVLDKHPELSAPADLYLEATDQHRGWFQSSLLVSIATRDHAPYKEVITHGFVVDTSTGEKISKSGDKPINAEYYYDKYGSDIVRLWVSSVDFRDEVPFSDEIFSQTTDAYRRIRNTLRILLGNLHDYDPERDRVSRDELTFIDRWILERLYQLTNECLQAYGNFEFRKVFHLLNQFCTVDLSSLYIDITKDRLYCEAANSPLRRATQSAMHELLESLIPLLAPILAYTADEAWEHLGKDQSVHLEDFPTANPENAAGEHLTPVEALLTIRHEVQKAIEEARQKKTIGSNLEARVELQIAHDHPASTLFKDPERIHEFFILSDLHITRGDALSVSVSATENAKCGRCWRHTDTVGQSEEHPELCHRCVDAIDRAAPAETSS